jgi:hypothetical protein
LLRRGEPRHRQIRRGGWLCPGSGPLSLSLNYGAGIRPSLSTTVQGEGIRGR